MNHKKDPMEQIIVDDLLREAASIDEEVLKNGTVPMPDGLKEKIKNNVHAQMKEMEKEKLYAKLSEEDRKALELGRKMLESSEKSSMEGKVVRRKKSRKVWLAVAAVAMLVLAMGITSIGGAQRVIEMVKSAVGGREVVRVNTDEDNYIVEVDKEEEAYQKIKDVFGVEAVKPTDWPEGTIFEAAEIDEELQRVSLYYKYCGELVVYYVSSHFTTSSWSVDVENKITDSYELNLDEVQVEIKEYEKPTSKEKVYSAKYSYDGLDYFLIGRMDHTEFELLVKNLKFF